MIGAMISLAILVCAIPAAFYLGFIWGQEYVAWGERIKEKYK